MSLERVTSDTSAPNSRVLVSGFFAGALVVTEVALEETARGAVVLWGNCSAVAGRDVPLGPFVDA